MNKHADRALEVLRAQPVVLVVGIVVVVDELARAALRRPRAARSASHRPTSSALRASTWARPVPRPASPWPPAWPSARPRRRRRPSRGPRRADPAHRSRPAAPHRASWRLLLIVCTAPVEVPSLCRWHVASWSISSRLKESRDFRLLFAGFLISMLGNQMTTVAIPYQTWRLTHSSLQVGLVSLAQLVPLIIGSLLGGAVGDAIDRRTIMLWRSLASAVTAGGLALNAAAPRPRWSPLPGQRSRRRPAGLRQPGAERGGPDAGRRDAASSVPTRSTRW